MTATLKERIKSELSRWAAVATKNSAEEGRDSLGQAKQNLTQLFRGCHDPVEALIEATDESAILRNDITIFSSRERLVRRRSWP